MGLERTGGFETVAFCEIEPFPRKVLAKHWPATFIHDDVRTLTRESLCKGYALNALLNHVCEGMGGSIACVKDAITSISENAGKRTAKLKERLIIDGPLSAEEALLIITAEDACVAESLNTHFWQSITNTITEMKSGVGIKALFGSSLSSADILTTIKYFVIIAIWQRPYTVPAHIKTLLQVTHNDILTAERLAADGIAVDVITGGFPCQDVSAAAYPQGRAGILGDRSGLFAEIIRLVGELAPKKVVLENVRGLLSNGIVHVLQSFSKVGYDAEWHTIPAAALGRPQARDRVWIIAYPSQERNQGPLESQRFSQVRQGWQGRQTYLLDVANSPFAGTSRFPQPLLCGMDGRVSDWVDRVGACGNSADPIIPELIGNAILQSIKEAA